MKSIEIYNSVKHFDFSDEIIEIEELSEDELLDIEVSDNHLFYANNILTKNSQGLPATCDFMLILGKDYDDIVYKSEIKYKIVKNRLGGRVGEMDRFYLDGSSLKLYCSSELEEFINDAIISGNKIEYADEDEKMPEVIKRKKEKVTPKNKPEDNYTPPKEITDDDLIKTEDLLTPEVFM